MRPKRLHINPSLVYAIGVSIANPITKPLRAQIPPTQLPNSINRPERQLTPLSPLKPIPPQPDPLQMPSTSPPQEPSTVPGTIKIERYEVVGSTVFSREELAKVTLAFVGSVSFDQIIQARDAVRNLYLSKRYLGTVVYIPSGQSIQIDSGVVKIQVVEHGLNAEQIKVTGTQRLNPGYVRSRLLIATGKPLNQNRLIEALRLLQLDPLIDSISADLSAGTKPGVNLLAVKVKEKQSFNPEISFDNNRSPSVGSVERRLQLNQANLLGLGDVLSAAYTNTDGSNTLDTQYRIPLSRHNTALILSYGRTSSNVIEQPFNQLDIIANSRYYNLTLRQPIIQTASEQSTEELAVGITADREESETSLLRLPFPLSTGADDQGRTRISALRFFQEYTRRSNREVLSGRSQFSFGLDALNSTINVTAPDSRFFAWLGEVRWLRVLAPDTFLLVRGDVQLADRPLVPLEQFALGGQASVRGYRQDALLTDDGAFASVEFQSPIYHSRSRQTVLQLIPFVDFGTAWNSSGEAAFNPNTLGLPNTLASAGLGLQLRQGNVLARFDWGIPIVDFPSRRKTWQENGLYFSLSYSPF